MGGGCRPSRSRLALGPLLAVLSARGQGAPLSPPGVAWPDPLQGDASNRWRTLPSLGEHLGTSGQR